MKNSFDTGKKKETSVLYPRYITCFTCFSRKTKSRLKRKQRIKNDKKVRRDAKDSVKKEYAKIYQAKRKIPLSNIS